MYLIITLFLSLGYTSAPGEHTNYWTQFRGADGLGIDTLSIAPSSWGESDYLWEIELPGTGHSSPVVWDDIIFVTSSEDELDLGYVMAVNEQNGELLWKKEFSVSDLVMHKDNNLASPSPAVDKSQVYFIWYSIERTRLTSLAHDGALLWQTDFGGIEARHGGGSSLVLTDKYVIFTREQEETSSMTSSWVAVDKKTGKVAWELERENAIANSFSTPILVHNEEGKAILIFASWAHGITALDPDSGKVIWTRKSLLQDRVVASPLYANGMIIACRRGETMVMEVNEFLSPLADTALYTLAPNLSPYVPTPIVVDELLFLFMDNGAVACVELSTGEVLWRERPAGPFYGSPICVQGNLYCISKDGEVIVLAALPGYELLGINDLGDESFSTPLVSGSGMIFRTYSKLLMLSHSN